MRFSHPNREKGTLQIRLSPPSCGFKSQGAGFRVQGSGFRVQGSGFRVPGSGFKVWGGWGVDREEVGGRAVRAEDDEVVDVLVRELDVPLHLVIPPEKGRVTLSS